MVIYIYSSFLAAKMLLFCDIYVVLVSPYCSRICSFREIDVPLQRFSLRHKQKTRTTDCHPVIEVVGYHCRRIINSVARGVYIILVKVCITHKRTSASTCFLSANETSYISMTKINKRWQTL